MVAESPLHIYNLSLLLGKRKNALAQSIWWLEQNLGFSLFYRSRFASNVRQPDPWQLTPEGHALLPYVRLASQLYRERHTRPGNAAKAWWCLQHGLTKVDRVIMMGELPAGGGVSGHHEENPQTERAAS